MDVAPAAARSCKAMLPMPPVAPTTRTTSAAPGAAASTISRAETPANERAVPKGASISAGRLASVPAGATGRAPSRRRLAGVLASEAAQDGRQDPAGSVVVELDRPVNPAARLEAPDLAVVGLSLDRQGGPRRELGREVADGVALAA